MKQIVLALCVATFTLQAFAQVSPPGAAPGSRLPSAVDPLTGLPIAPQPDEPRFSIDFPGGPPQELVAAIEKTSDQRPNIVIHPDIRGSEMPAFRLREITVSQLFSTLNSLAEPDYAQGIWKQVPMQEGQVWTLTKFNPKLNYASLGMPGMGYGAPVQPPVQRSCKIFNLTPYLEKFTVEDITTAVQGAWDLLQSDGMPSVKYHKDTKLLIVVGIGQDIAVVTDVLQQLSTSAEFNRPKDGNPAVKTPPPPAKDSVPAAKK